MSYQCEHCGQRMDDPAATESFQGYREVVVVAFCRDCAGDGRVA